MFRERKRWELANKLNSLENNIGVNDNDIKKK